MAKKAKSSRRRRISARKAATLPGSPALDELARKCANDPAFFDYLLRDRDAALASAGIDLTSGDVERVRLATEGGGFTADVPMDKLKDALARFTTSSPGEWPPPTWLCQWLPVRPLGTARTGGASGRGVARKRSSPRRRRP